jgi:hypothetical protein
MIGNLANKFFSDFSSISHREFINPGELIGQGREK